MSVATRRTRVGDLLPPVSMQMSVEKFIAHEPKLLPAETIHSDLEAAAREGFQRPVAGGPMVMATIYRMRVDGYLGQRWSDYFDGLTIIHDADGSTSLVGAIRDQAALYGLIDKARDLGLTLLTVERLAPGVAENSDIDAQG